MPTKPKHAMNTSDTNNSESVVRFNRVQWSPEALRYSPQSWLSPDSLVIPGFAPTLSAGGEYAQFIEIREYSAEQDEWAHWSVLFHDCFPNGGGDGDSESFETKTEAVQCALEHARKYGFTFCPINTALV